MGSAKPEEIKYRW